MKGKRITSTMPEISIVIVNYNAGKYLEHCLKSIAEQSYQDFEVIIVDNASSDSSLDCVCNFSNVQIVHNSKNVGFAVAQNQGMHLARGQYLMPLNFDIRLSTTFLHEMHSAIEQSAKIGTVSGKLYKMDSNGTSTGRIDNAGILLPRNRFPVHRGGNELDQGQYDEPVFLFGAMGAAALYRREMLEDVAYENGYFDETFFMWYEDIDLDWRARIFGWDCVYAPNAIAYHVGDPHGHGKSAFGAEISMRNRWKMIVSNECLRCLVMNSPWLMWEELALLYHVMRHGLFGAYFRALLSFIVTLPHTLKKRRWIRRRALFRCLPEYPILLERHIVE